MQMYLLGLGSTWSIELCIVSSYGCSVMVSFCCKKGGVVTSFICGYKSEIQNVVRSYAGLGI